MNNKQKRDNMMVNDDLDKVGNFRTMYSAQAFHESKGMYFFSDGAKRFFSSRISDNIYGGCVFVTSEKYDWSSPRLYTIRYIGIDGDIHSYSGFQEYSSRNTAHYHARKLGDWIKSERKV